MYHFCFVLALDEGDIALLKTYVSLFKWLQKSRCFVFKQELFCLVTTMGWVCSILTAPDLYTASESGWWCVQDVWSGLCKRSVFKIYVAKLDFNGKFKCLDICFSWVWWLTPFAQHSELSQVWDQLGVDHVQVRKCRTAIGKCLERSPSFHCPALTQQGLVDCCHRELCLSFLSIDVQTL